MMKTLSLFLLTSALATSLITASEDDAKVKNPGTEKPEASVKSAGKESGGQLTDSKKNTSAERKKSEGESPGKRNQKEKRRNRPEPGAFFDRTDSNEDGKLTEDEVRDRLWSRISRFDKDEDSAVSKEEALAGFRAMRNREGGRGSRGGPNAGKIFQRSDENGDGKLSEDEVPELFWNRIAKLDKDDDGAVTKEEFAAVRERTGRRGARDRMGSGKGRSREGGHHGPDAMFRRLDEDEDGKLSKEEAPDEMWERLSRADDNADGLVSKEELEKVFRSRRGK